MARRQAEHVVDEAGRAHPEAQVHVVAVPAHGPGAGPEATHPVEHRASEHEGVAVDGVDRFDRDAPGALRRRPEPEVDGVVVPLAHPAEPGWAPPPGSARLLRRRAAEARDAGVGQRGEDSGEDLGGVEVQSRVLVEEAQDVVGGGLRAVHELVVAARDVGGALEREEPVRAAGRRQVVAERGAQAGVLAEREDDQHRGGRPNWARPLRS